MTTTLNTLIGHFIGGERTSGSSSSRTQAVMNPSTGAEQGSVPLASVEEVHAAIAVAEKAQVVWAKMNHQKRIRVINKWISLIHDNLDEIATTLSLEHGKTFEDAKGDVARGTDVLEFTLGAPHQLKGEYSSGVGTGIDTYSLRQPLGVVAAISPFNFPAMIPLWQTGPALAAGNSVVLKPSERDPSPGSSCRTLRRSRCPGRCPQCCPRRQRGSGCTLGQPGHPGCWFRRFHPDRPVHLRACRCHQQTRTVFRWCKKPHDHPS